MIDFDAMTHRDWTHIRETAERLREESDTEEIIMTSQGYVCVCVYGSQDHECDVTAHNQTVRGDEWDSYANRAA